MFPRLVRRFLTDIGGSYAVIFAVAALPMMAGVGAAVDYVQASSLRSNLARSMDNAALAGLQDWTQGKSRREIETTVRALILANLDPKFEDALKVAVKLPGKNGRQDREIKLSARLEFKPMMAPLYAAVTGQRADQYDYVIQIP